MHLIFRHFEGRTLLVFQDATIEVGQIVEMQFDNCEGEWLVWVDGYKGFHRLKPIGADPESQAKSLEHFENAISEVRAALLLTAWEGLNPTDPRPRFNMTMPFGLSKLEPKQDAT